MLSSKILNSRFDALTLTEAVAWADQWIISGRTGCLCTVNVSILMMMARSPRLQRIVDESALVVADGMPIVWASRLLTAPLPERVPGIDLMQRLAAETTVPGLRIYLLGGTAEIVSAAARKMQADHPNCVICGFGDGYFSETEAPERVRQIRDSRAQVVLVGMGVPRQEFFIDDHGAGTGANLVIGVGGSFDVLAGRKRRAPRQMQALGLEWAYRMFQEPGRLGRRYAVTGLQFLAALTVALLRLSGRARVHTGLEAK